MSHIRTTVRNAVVSRLRDVGGFGLVEPRLRILRGVQPDQFPVALVSVSDTGAAVGKNPPGQRPLQRTLVITVQVSVTADVEEIDEKLDELAVKVEQSLSDPTQLGFGKVLDWTYFGTAEASEDEAAEVGVSSLRIQYRGTVTTPEGQPSVNQHQ